MYEKPTPAGDSRKRMFASENQIKKERKLRFHVLSFWKVCNMKMKGEILTKTLCNTLLLCDTYVNATKNILCTKMKVIKITVALIVITSVPCIFIKV